MENSKIITYNLSEDLIENTADLLYRDFFKKGKPMERVACIFGGRRPALFLKRALSKRIKKGFVPPATFSIDEFMEYLVSKFPLNRVSELDSCYHIYRLAEKIAPDILKGRGSFNDFIPWAREIVSFIEQLDLEDIESESLKSIQKSAEIGYEIPENINLLLQHIVKIRKAYHAVLKEKGLYSRGVIYLNASKFIDKKALKEFDKILFCDLYYLHKTEQNVIKNIFEKEKGICIFHGSQENWSVLKRNAEMLKTPIKPEQEEKENYKLNLHQGFDMHSQVCVIREILKQIKNKENTVIVMPRPEAVIPLLSEISAHLKEFNVSLGYPLKRSSLYALFELLLKVQESKRDNKYYTKDYLNILKHPLVKNLKINQDPAITRVLVHKLEEIMQGEVETSISGSLFLSLRQIERETKIFQLTAETLSHMKIDASTDDCREILQKLHTLFFTSWQGITTFKDFSERLGNLLDVLVKKSMVWRFPFNLKFIEKLFDIKEELESASFSEEPFEEEIELWEIFRQKLQSEMVSFAGSPLRGTQILGLFETRSLNFENVIVMDMNEAVLPRLKMYEPLIPREVMMSLGLNRLEMEEEIQRYQFMRLISGAKNAHLVYEENREREKSRFIEELLWKRQKRANRLEVFTIPQAGFSMKVRLHEKYIEKTPETIEFLEKETYSATRLDTYLNCPLKFYYRYVLGLKEREDLLEGPESVHIGRFIHELLESTFQKFLRKRPVIDEKFRKSFFYEMDKKFKKEIELRMRSDSFLLRGIIRERLKKFLENEKERNVAKILRLEERQTGKISFNHKQLKFTYTVDRIDELENKSLVIIDYKTGGMDLSPKKLKTIEGMEMSRGSIRENIKSFQLPLYYHFVSKDFKGADINAGLYNIRTLEPKLLFRDEDLYDYSKKRIMEICLEALDYIFKEIFDPKVPFMPDKDERKCRFCSFPLMCR